MSHYEKKLAKTRLLLAAKAGEYLFRTNAGQAWTGKFGKTKGRITTIIDAMRIKLLPPGTPDYCGFKSVVITEEMVGKRVAVFLAEEHKATKSDRMRKDQITAKGIIIREGGIHRTVWHDERVEEVRGWE